MAHKLRKRVAKKPGARARVFAALGDKTRLALVSKLAAGKTWSITQLAGDSKLTRQAITKHLGVLQRAGIVRSSYAGRERLFEFDPEPMDGLRDFLNVVSKQWDQAAARSKLHTER